MSNIIIPKKQQKLQSRLFLGLSISGVCHKFWGSPAKNVWQAKKGHLIAEIGGVGGVGLKLGEWGVGEC